MKIAIAQLNPTVGDLAGNAALVKAAAAQAVADGAELLVTSELMISGYPPKDLLLREGFAAACRRSVEQLATQLDPGLGVLVGHPDPQVPIQGIKSIMKEYLHEESKRN
jgi:NAD+ synthase (glutamine-hydrolysing)